MALVDKAKSIYETIQKYIKDTENWKQVKQVKEVTVWWKQSPEWNGTLYKTEGYMETSPETVFSYVDPSPTSPRMKWDKAVKEIQLVEQVNQDVSVIRTLTHSAFGGIISSRDFVDLVINTKSDEALATQSMGIEHNDCPVTTEHVRGMNYPCAIICQRVPGNPDRTKMTTFIQTDLGGMLPKSVVDSALPSNMVNFFTSLKKTLQDDGHWKGNITNGTEI